MAAGRKRRRSLAALRPKRSALRASQAFAPAAANEQAKPASTEKRLPAQAERKIKRHKQEDLNPIVVDGEF